MPRSLSSPPPARLPLLGASLLRAGHRFPEHLRVRPPPLPHPERVLQFGEGRFLRAFFDWMLDRMNGEALFDGRAVLVQPTATGTAREINAQDGLYTVVLRGLQYGQVMESREVITSVSRCIDPYLDPEALRACAANPELRFVVSSTTEAGIRTDGEDRLSARPAASFPGKLTQLLWARFEHFQGAPQAGMVMLPCEPVDRNGDALKRAVAETAERWRLPPAFSAWLEASCLFTNTVVDRLVSGDPDPDGVAALAEELGYQDRLLVRGETFHSWVIESPRPLEDELPLREAGLDVVWTANVDPYRERKVRILDGSQAMTAPAAFLAGKDTMADCMDDDLVRSYLQRGINDEILPTLKLPRGELLELAAVAGERFRNPFIEHRLLDIARGSIVKYRTSIVTTLADHARLRRALPRRLTFALAALAAFYRGAEIRNGALMGRRDGGDYRVEDEASVLEFFRGAWTAIPWHRGLSLADARDLARRLCARGDFWGQDLAAALPELADAVAEHLVAIVNRGARAALAAVV